MIFVAYFLFLEFFFFLNQNAFNATQAIFEGSSFFPIDKRHSWCLIYPHCHGQTMLLLLRCTLKSLTSSHSDCTSFYQSFQKLNKFFASGAYANVHFWPAPDFFWVFGFSRSFIEVYISRRKIQINLKKGSIMRGWRYFINY